MTEQTGASDGRRRGGGFPSMSLQEAVDAILVSGQHGPDHGHDAFSTYLGHKTANSGSYRLRLASLRDWGLIERGDRDRVTLSDLAQRLVLATLDSDETKPLLLAAFESCRVFGMLYNDSAKNTPMDIGRLRTTAVMRYGVQSEQADKFVESFIKSALFAGLADSDGSKVLLRPRDVAFDSGTVDAERESDPDLDMASIAVRPPVAIQHVDGGIGPPANRTSAQALSGSIVEQSTPAVATEHGVSAAPTAFRQIYNIDGGEIEFTIRTPKPLPPGVYALMADIAVTAEKMADLLKPAPKLEPVAD